jgi:hypothetical protein
MVFGYLIWKELSWIDQGWTLATAYIPIFNGLLPIHSIQPMWLPRNTLPLLIAYGISLCR